MSTTALERAQADFRREFDDSIHGAGPGAIFRLANELRAAGQSDTATALVRPIIEAEAGGNTFEYD